MRVLSLGWGIQSTTLAAMVAFGELPVVPAAIHADTHHESLATYDFARRRTPWLEARGVRVVTVNDPSVDRLPPAGRGVYIPAFTATDARPRGQLRRTCTQRWKIAPIRRWLQANRGGQPVDLLLGISTDEALRVRPSDVGYITNRYPLLDLGMSRSDCEAWLKAHDLEVPTKSACVFCPYRDTREWRRIRAVPQDWQRSVDVDAAIRFVNPPYRLYVHPARQPLDMVDFRTPEEQGQMRLWDDECTGLCGV